MKKALSLILCLCFIFTLGATSVLAAEDNPVNESGAPTDIAVLDGQAHDGGNETETTTGDGETGTQDGQGNGSEDVPTEEDKPTDVNDEDSETEGTDKQVDGSPDAAISGDENIDGDGMTIAPFAGADGINARINELKKIFPDSCAFFTANGSSCGHLTSETCYNCSLNGVLANNPYIARLPGYSRPSLVNGYTCVSFARFAYWYIFGFDEFNSSRMWKTTTPRVGDYVKLYNSSIGAHYGIYLGQSAEKIYLFHCNYGTTAKVFYYDDFTKSKYTITYWTADNYNSIQPPISNTPEPKLIGNVTVSEVSSYEYKVSAHIQTAPGHPVNRIQFPTWTEAKGQDDLPGDWGWNPAFKGKGTAGGTNEKDVFSFYVKDSDHNYERGVYITHVYAIDIVNGVDRYTMLGQISVNLQNKFEPIVSFTHTNGHRYEVYADSLTWAEAKAKCEQLGGHLATITSPEESNALAAKLPAKVNTNRRGYFLGASDARQEGKWEWITGEPFEYSNWYPSEPNGLTGENYMATTSTNAQWNDTNGILPGYGFICEYPPVATSVRFNKNILDVVEGDVARITAVTEPAAAMAGGGSWSSSHPSVATVDSAGNITTVTPGTTIISFKPRGAAANVIATCQLTVKSSIVLEKITLTETTLSVTEGSSKNLSVLPFPAGAALPSGLIWESNNPAVAAVIGGKIHGLAAGTAMVTVFTPDRRMKTTCRVTVARALSLISFSPSSITILQGRSVAVPIVGTPSSAALPGNIVFKITEGAGTVITLTTDEDSRTAVIKAVGIGSATITASGTMGGDIGTHYTATCKVTVAADTVSPASVVVSGPSFVEVRKNIQLSAQVLPENADQQVTWRCNNSNALVDKNGVVTGVTPGSATITATTKTGAKLGQWQITVTKQQVAISATVYDATTGTVSGSGTYVFGDDVLVKAVAASGYRFLGWYENNTLIPDAGMNYNFSAASVRLLEARFIPEGQTVASAHYPVVNQRIRGIMPGTPVEVVVSRLVNQNVVVLDMAGKPVAAGNIIGTGMTIGAGNGNDQPVTVKITGDVTGDGKINASDILSVRLHVIKKQTLEGVFYEAACANMSTPNATAILNMRLHVLKLVSILQ